MSLLTTDGVAGRPVPHDFPFPSCFVCRFPVPQWDLAGDEYRPRHASTCATTCGDHEPAERASDVTAAVVGAGGLPTVPTLRVKGVAHRLRRRPHTAALDPEPPSARRLAAGAGGTACPAERPPVSGGEGSLA